MLLKRPLKDVGPWRGIVEPSTVTSFSERKRVVEKHGLLVELVKDERFYVCIRVVKNGDSK